MNEGILSVIGNTPLISLTRIFPDIHFRLYAKLESFNPGGSTKDRPAFSIIKNAMETGAIRPNSVVIESSSGNMGIGLAQACSYYGLRFICVVDPKTTSQNIRLLEAYGAEIDVVTEPDPTTGEFLKARIDRVKAILYSVENAFWPNQYSNIYNPIAHHQTMQEIATALNGEVDYLFCATSTCGTMRGCVEYIRNHNLRTKVYAVDAVGSVIFGGEKAKRLIPGHGAGVVPHLFQEGLADACVHVSDMDCIIGCRRLVLKEAVLAGGSSGAVLMAVNQMKESIPKDSTCVMVFPDRGERYMDTIYSNKWVQEHFGNVSYLWEDYKEVESCATAIY